MPFPIRRRRKKKEEEPPQQPGDLQAEVARLSKKVDTLDTYVNAMLDSFGLRKRITAPERCLAHPGAQIKKLRTWEFQRRVYTEFECPVDGERWIEEVER